MKELEQLRERLAAQRPEEWEKLPDLALYMDQLISYMPRQLIRPEGGDTLTSAMVNNYIKDGLLPRAEGKRYGKTHLAYLTAICALKSVLSIKETSVLISSLGEDKSTEELYAVFLELLDGSLTTAAEGVDPTLEREDLCRLGWTLALNSYASKLACQRVLSLLGEDASAAKSEPKTETKKRGGHEHE